MRIHTRAPACTRPYTTHLYSLPHTLTPTPTPTLRLGLLQEVAKCGTVSLKYNADDKITHIDYSFDVMSMWRQMQNAVASRDPVLVPTTPATANRVARMPHVVTGACYPWRIIEASAAFTELTGYSREECVGSTLGLLLGVIHTSQTDAHAPGLDITFPWRA